VAALVGQSEFMCSHLPTGSRKTAKIHVGDVHLINCNVCGAFIPKQGSQVIRAKHRQYQQMKLYSSDVLRTMYSQCQQKSQRTDLNMKISSSYQEVRSLIIDWLCEVTEGLHLQGRSLFHAVSVLDKFLSLQLKQRGVEMVQNLVMLQGLACLFIAAKNYEMDPTVPSSKKFLR
jgi:hypothetical protein